MCVRLCGSVASLKILLPGTLLRKPHRLVAEGGEGIAQIEREEVGRLAVVHGIAGSIRVDGADVVGDGCAVVADPKRELVQHRCRNPSREARGRRDGGVLRDCATLRS